MTGVLLWKEYRQQRNIWVAMAMLGVCTAGLLVASLGRRDASLAAQEWVVTTVSAVMILFVAVYGVMVGALLLAEDKEAGTLAFLDNLSGHRSPVFLGKVVAGLALTMSQAIALGVVCVAFGSRSWVNPLYLQLAGLDGLVWGLLAGALYRTGLTAVLFGLVSLSITPLLVAGMNALAGAMIGQDTFIANVAVPFFTAIIATATAAYLSWLTYCREDLARRVGPRGYAGSGWVLVMPAWSRVLGWLMIRQGRWILGAGVVLLLLWLFPVLEAPLILWPAGTMLWGLACGLAVFAADQGSGARFIGSQRLSLNRIWFVKVVFWAAVCAVLVAPAWFWVTSGHVDRYGHDSRAACALCDWTGMSNDGFGIGRTMAEFGNGRLLLLIWPVYGFCFGLLFGQFTRQLVGAFFLSSVLAPLAAAIWTPSLFFERVPLWELLLTPVGFLALSRLAMRPWVAERLCTGRPAIAISICGVLLLASPAGLLWWRVVEVPDVGAPFDMATFDIALNKAAKQQATLAIPKALAAFEKHEKKVDLEFTDESNLHEGESFKWGPIWVRESGLWQDVFKNGWRKEDKQQGKWLDRLFEGSWAKEVHKAARLPLGLAKDPRHVQPMGERSRVGRRAQQVGNLLVLRAYQLQARGDSRGALEHLETALGLSRQMMNYMPSLQLFFATSLENSARSAYRIWLENVGPDKELLQAGLAVLQRHEAEKPDPAGTIKADYLIYSRIETGLDTEKPGSRLVSVLYEVPWIKERQSRLLQAVTLGQLRELQMPPWERGWLRFRREAKGEPTLSAMSFGLPLDDGPGSTLSAEQWSALIDTSQEGRRAFCLPEITRHQFWFAFAKLATAVAIYQVDHGKAPETLQGLVPEYLPAIPLNPWDGKQFGYRISKGEKSEDWHGDPVELKPGQAVVYSEAWNGDDWVVPVWKK